MGKRCFDVFLSIVSALLLSPLLLTVALILKFTGEGDVFYKQERVGRHKTLFDMTKFATMLKNSPQIGNLEHTLQNDPRVLPVGRFIRRSKINELPQLWDIFIGRMSFVGPRPTTMQHFKLFSSQYVKAIYDTKPGLTGVGSIVFRDEESILTQAENYEACFKNEIVPYKEELEMWYVQKQTVGVDLALIFITGYSIVKPHNSLLFSLFPCLPFKDISKFG